MKNVLDLAFFFSFTFIFLILVQVFSKSMIIFFQNKVDNKHQILNIFRKLIYLSKILALIFLITSAVFFGFYTYLIVM